MRAQHVVHLHGYAAHRFAGLDVCERFLPIPVHRRASLAIVIDNGDRTRANRQYHRVMRLDDRVARPQSKAASGPAEPVAEARPARPDDGDHTMLLRDGAQHREREPSSRAEKRNGKHGPS